MGELSVSVSKFLIAQLHNRKLTVKCRPSHQVGKRGTIKPKANFDAKEDAVALRKAIEGLGTLSF